jgi:hypothetical protein
MEEGTWASHWSSSLESVEARDEYHEPAWLATLVVILKLTKVEVFGFAGKRGWMWGEGGVEG